MSDKEQIENDYRVKVKSNEKGGYNVIVDNNTPYEINIDEDKGNVQKMMAITLVGVIIIIGIVVFFYSKLDSSNDKAVALQKKVDYTVKEKLEVIQSSQSEIENLKKQNDALSKRYDALNKRLLGLQELNKSLEDKLDIALKTNEKIKNQVTEKKQAITCEDYYLINKPIVPANNQKVPEIPSSKQQIPTVPSSNIEIPKVPYLN